MLQFQTRPIETWPRPMTRGRRRSRFSGRYGQTLTLLERELSHLQARAVVLLMAYREQDIRLDGKPQANAQPQHPGVILSFSSPRGAMQFPCDTFDHWQDNLRAIALALEALRTVDRYGVTSSGEQYTGWKALPSPNGDHWTLEQALEFINELTGPNSPPAIVDKLRQAEMKTHPDRGGNASDFHKVQQARKLLLD